MTADRTWPSSSPCGPERHGLNVTDLEGYSHPRLRPGHPPSDHDRRRITYDVSVTSEGIPAASASKRRQQGIELVSNDVDCTDLAWKRNLEA